MSLHSKEHLPESEFLRKFAVDSYNKKYKRNLDYKNFIIRSVKNAFGYKYGYQVETIRSDDHVVIMLYFNLGIMTCEHIVRVEMVQNVDVSGGLGDEVYVVTGEVARYYLDEGVYKFKWLKSNDFNFTAVMFMDNDYVEFMDGDYLSWVSDEPAPPFPPVAANA